MLEDLENAIDILEKILIHPNVFRECLSGFIDCQLDCIEKGLGVSGAHF
jgi:hypothetical protein